MFWDSSTQMEISLPSASVRGGSSQQGLMSRASARPSISYQLYCQPELEDFQISYRSNCLLASNIEVLPRKKSALFCLFGTSHMIQFGVQMVWLLGHIARHMKVQLWMYSKTPTPTAFCARWVLCSQSWNLFSMGNDEWVSDQSVVLSLHPWINVDEVF